MNPKWPSSPSESPTNSAKMVILWAPIPASSLPFMKSSGRHFRTTDDERKVASSPAEGEEEDGVLQVRAGSSAEVSASCQWLWPGWCKGKACDESCQSRFCFWPLLRSVHFFRFSLSGISVGDSVAYDLPRWFVFMCNTLVDLGTDSVMIFVNRPLMISLYLSICLSAFLSICLFIYSYKPVIYTYIHIYAQTQA